MYYGITEAKATDDYKLLLCFENNERRVFDMRQVLNIGRFAELKDISVFKSVFISFDTVEWNNGLDLDPEYLYEKSRKIEADE